MFNHLSPEMRVRDHPLRADHAGSQEIGGLQLAVGRVHGKLDLASGHFRIVSLQSGKARVRIGDAQTDVGENDHFGACRSGVYSYSAWRRSFGFP